jgi:chromosome partitioning protein
MVAAHRGGCKRDDFPRTVRPPTPSTLPDFLGCIPLRSGSRDLPELPTRKSYYAAREAAPALAGQWMLIDTAPTTWLVVQEAIRAATMVVIPVRPGFFDLAAVRETVATAREFNKPYAVVINAAPVKREDKEAPAVALSRAQFERLSVPVWSGQISQRTAFLGSLAVGASAGEIYGDSACKVEIARLWSAMLGRCNQPRPGGRRRQSGLT